MSIICIARKVGKSQSGFQSCQSVKDTWTSTKRFTGSGPQHYFLSKNEWNSRIDISNKSFQYMYYDTILFIEQRMKLLSLSKSHNSNNLSNTMTDWSYFAHPQISIKDTFCIGAILANWKCEWLLLFFRTKCNILRHPIIQFTVRGLLLVAWTTLDGRIIDLWP